MTFRRNIDGFAGNCHLLGGFLGPGGSFSWDSWPFDGQFGVLDRAEVAGRSGDAESEEVAEASDVAAGGMDLVQDAVLAHGLGPQGRAEPGVVGSCRDEPGCGAPVDEQVWVGAVRPGPVGVVGIAVSR